MEPREIRHVALLDLTGAGAANALDGVTRIAHGGAPLRRVPCVRRKRAASFWTPTGRTGARRLAAPRQSCGQLQLMRVKQGRVVLLDYMVRVGTGRVVETIAG